MRGGARERALSGRLGSLWEGMVSSFWFLPGLLTASGILLFGVLENLAVLTEGLAGGERVREAVESAWGAPG